MVRRRESKTCCNQLIEISITQQTLLKYPVPYPYSSLRLVGIIAYRAIRCKAAGWRSTRIAQDFRRFAIGRPGKSALPNPFAHIAIVERALVAEGVPHHIKSRSHDRSRFACQVSQQLPQGESANLLPIRNERSKKSLARHPSTPVTKRHRNRSL